MNFFFVLMSGFHVWYLLINIHKALSIISQSRLRTTGPPDQGEGHVTSMVISLICMGLLYTSDPLQSGALSLHVL